MRSTTERQDGVSDKGRGRVVECWYQTFKMRVREDLRGIAPCGGDDYRLSLQEIWGAREDRAGFMVSRRLVIWPLAGTWLMIDGYK